MLVTLAGFSVREVSWWCMDGKDYRFEAVIEPGMGGGALIRFPFDVRQEFGTRGQVKVQVTFDGHPYRGSLAPMGDGGHVLGVRKDIRTAIGKGLGDSVEVVLQRDTAPRLVEVPALLQAALDKNLAAKDRFAALSYTHQKEYARWVSEAKRDETRTRRIEKTISDLLK